MFYVGEEKTVGIADHKKTLLLIDNAEENELELGVLLQDEYQIIRTGNTEEGIAYLNHGDTAVSAVLLSSLTLQKKSIESFMDLLKKNVKLSAIPVLLLAEESITQKELDILSYGVIDCIEKPYQAGIILNRISNAIIMKDSLDYYEIEEILKQLPSNIYMKDSEGRYIFATHYWHHLDHKDDPSWSIRGKRDVEIRKDTENALAAMESDMNVIKSGKGTAYTIEINEDGLQEFYDVIKEPIRNKAGAVTGIVGLIHNVTEHEKLKRKLREKVIVDELTGIYNRYYFDQWIMKLTDSDSYPISVISADCDGLKVINDTYGHMVGDEYIRMTTLLFKMVLPEEKSLMFRTGGDEFIILLMGVTEEQAGAYIEEMKDKEKMFHIKDRSLSVSFGLSSIQSSKDSVTQCIEVSDMNMYAEKRKKKQKKDQDTGA